MEKLKLYKCDPSRNIECPAHNRCDGNCFKNNEKYIECYGTSNINGAKLDKFGVPITINPLEDDIETAKRNYIRMFNDLVADENLTTEKIKTINQMINIILEF